MINIYTQVSLGEAWLHRYRGKLPIFACILGFTETGLVPGISAAGLTPEDRQYTACADAEFLYYGAEYYPKYPLPPLTSGASPVLISRAVVANLHIPVYLFNAGLLHIPPVPLIDLGGMAARCLSQGAAMDIATVKQLLTEGLRWGSQLSYDAANSYLILSECVVGGTTTALAILTGLGIDAVGKVNSSHAVCNHKQKWDLVQTGLAKISSSVNPLELVAAVGDPMQVVVAGMAIAASRSCGVLLGGGTQMLAVYALIQAIAHTYSLSWKPAEIVIGTTRWVAEDPTGATIDLAQSFSKNSIPPLLATKLSFANSRYPQLQAYERGFVKEGVGAGAACIAASLSQNWQQNQLLAAIEAEMEQLSSNQETQQETKKSSV
ncbi:nicotinate mononucleotide-dependent phosphoribosyltransferase CobT [Dolichospermum flos-aquae]|uniref:TIGR00303 family protein n=1 Tax=Dolichospermum flos-aquae LEGE 04289 TaxID=1828708 RepID=A0ACC5Q499_DOLFA|nr:TIGR00303 family protein [Dolichospermum flos-aquae]MBE9219403.1 TIGR00303 family protein [Dolichospermum flos-aquae LEGE 04289]